MNSLESPNKKDRKRLGRGHGSGHGKTCGKGHKGLKARSGGSVKLGFEGGQTPIDRRLPKFGFVSRKSLVREEIRTNDLNKVKGDVVSIESLKESGLISSNIKYVKIFLSGDVNKAVKVLDIPVSKGARVAIEKAGGKIETSNG